MSKIILDLQVAEVYSLGLGDSVKNKYEKNYDSLNAFYTSVLKHYNISFEDYNHAMDWYKNHPIMMDSLFVTVSKELTSVRKLDSIKDLPLSTTNPYVGKPKPDSLSKNEKKTDSLKHIENLKKVHSNDSLKSKINKKLKVPVVHTETTFPK